MVCAWNEAATIGPCLVSLLAQRRAPDRIRVSITSLGPYPYIANSDFHQPRHLASWKTLLRCEQSWPAICATLRANVDVAVVMHRPPAVARATVDAAHARRAPWRLDSCYAKLTPGPRSSGI